MEHMVKVGDSLSDPKKSLEDLMERGHETLICKIKKLREDIEAKRLLQIKEKLNECGKKLQNHIHGILSTTSRENQTSEKNIESEVPHLGIESSLCILNGLLPGSPDKEFANAQEPVLSKSTKLQKVQKIPPYTTWIFLHRNQRMPEDQSVVGRRRIYYDQSGNEALICSDSEDDIAEMDEEKREFSSGEDQIIWMAFQEHGLNEDVIDVVSHFIGGTSVEIQERYHELKQKLETTQLQDSTKSNTFLEKSLSAALDSLDNLFCRRCLVFDCRLHGCSQNLVYPSEKQLSWCEPEDKKPCSDKCYLRTRQSAVVHGSVIDSVIQRRRNILERGNTCWSALSCKDDVCDGGDTMHSLEFAAGETSISETTSSARVAPVMHHGSMGKRKGNDVDDVDDEEFGGVGVSDNSLDKKMKKNQVVDSVTACGEAASATAISSVRTDTSNVRPSNKMDIQVADNCFMQSLSPSTFTAPRILNSPTVDTVQDERQDLNDKLGLKEKTKSLREQTKTLSTGCEWKPLEKDLYAKGLEIFGRNSCLIARNLLSGLKTCSEVFTYMHSGGVPPKKLDAAHSSEGLVRADSDYMEQELSVRPRSRLIRKRGRSKRLKYSTKSNGHPSSWRRIGDGDHSCKQYTPCSCQNVCGKDCSCLNNGTCCEKYCGCSKSCKNRFRGCHCAKSNCRSRQCPCFAANRECDPDVCRNCWVSCGGGSLGEPPKRGDGQCGNMRLLLRQQQRVLLARSDVAGWGAFIKNSVNKHDYLGEYTGELISHREADKRGKIYDRANSSFLFDLNDQYVLDACRQGDKLKFANHSSKPNCYCKVMLVAGDHRVGIFAKERIEAKEELFYDYRYGPDQAPAWARTPGTSKKDDALPCQGRPRKHQSR